VDWFSIICVAFALAMDAFAVSIAAALRLGRPRPRQVFRMAFHFGLFQFMMPVLGWLAGRGVHRWISAVDHWVAFGLLAVVGGKMLWDSFRPARDKRGDPTRGWTLVMLSVATSIDALAVGLSMAMLGVSVWLPSVVIGVVAAAMTAVGMVLAGRVAPGCGKWAELLGGAVLLGIGVRILLSHLCGI